jgi:peptidyl-prolyl cis-trans isomerase D
MLDAMRRGSRLIMWIVIVGVGGVFVLYLGFQGGFQSTTAPDVVLRVGDRAYRQRDLDRLVRQTQEQNRQILGDAYDSEAMAEQLNREAAGFLARNAILAGEAERLGLRVSAEEVRDYVRRIPGATDAQGRLDRDVLTNYAEREFGSRRRFEDSIRDDLLAMKLARLISESVEVSDAEARDAVRYRLEQVTIAAVKLDGTQPAPDEVAPDDAVKALLEKDPKRVRDAYEARRAEFDQKEQARARHILIRVDPNADEATKAAARKRIEEIRARIEAGASFEDVAREVSEDPGSKEKGGDLGSFPRGAMVKPFEDAVFALQPGQTSGVVESDFGLHLIRLEEKRPAVVVPFEEADEQVARDLVRQDAAAAVAKKRAEQLSEAVKSGKPLIDAARDLQLSILRPAALSRRPDGYVPDVGVAPDVLAAAFRLQPEAPSDPTVYEPQPSVFVLIQLLERKTPSDVELAAALPSERERLRMLRRVEAQNQWVETRRAELARGGEFVENLAAR